MARRPAIAVAYAAPRGLSIACPYACATCLVATRARGTHLSLFHDTLNQNLKITTSFSGAPPRSRGTSPSTTCCPTRWDSCWWIPCPSLDWRHSICVTLPPQGPRTETGVAGSWAVPQASSQAPDYVQLRSGCQEGCCLTVAKVIPHQCW